jgi:hypothetical protein
MTRLTTAVLVVGGLGVVVGSAVMAQDNQPGRPSVARVLVSNRARSEAIPVMIQGGDVQPVTVMGTPMVGLVPNTSVASRAVRQAWEYTHLPVNAGIDPTAALNAAGTEGWEAVGFVTIPGGNSAILLKRPR